MALRFEESRMMMLNNLRRVSLSFAALALVVAPIGCNSDAPPSAVVEVNPAPTHTSVPILDKVEGEVDRDIRQTAGEVKHEAEDVKKAVEDDKHDLKATEENIKKSTEGAVENVTGEPK
jgi:hypothetical protein